MKETFLSEIKPETFDSFQEEYSIIKNGKTYSDSKKLLALYELYKEENPLAVSPIFIMKDYFDEMKEQAAFNTGALMALALFHKQGEADYLNNLYDKKD